MGVYVVVHLCACTKVIRSVQEECLTPACESDVTVLTGCHGNRGHRASLLTDCVYCHKEVQERERAKKGREEACREEERARGNRHERSGICMWLFAVI